MVQFSRFPFLIFMTLNSKLASLYMEIMCFFWKRIVLRVFSSRKFIWRDPFASKHVADIQYDNFMLFRVSRLLQRGRFILMVKLFWNKTHAKYRNSFAPKRVAKICDWYAFKISFIGVVLNTSQWSYYAFVKTEV